MISGALKSKVDSIQNPHSLGPIFATPSQTPLPRSEHPSTVEAALRTVDHALGNLCHIPGLSVARRSDVPDPISPMPTTSYAQIYKKSIVSAESGRKAQG